LQVQMQIFAFAIAFALATILTQNLQHIHMHIIGKTKRCSNSGFSEPFHPKITICTNRYVSQTE